MQGKINSSMAWKTKWSLSCWPDTALTYHWSSHSQLQHTLHQTCYSSVPWGSPRFLSHPSDAAGSYWECLQLLGGTSPSSTGPGKNLWINPMNSYEKFHIVKHNLHYLPKWGYLPIFLFFKVKWFYCTVHFHWFNFLKVLMAMQT